MQLFYKKISLKIQMQCYFEVSGMYSKWKGVHYIDGCGTLKGDYSVSVYFWHSEIVKKKFFKFPIFIMECVHYGTQQLLE